MVRCFVLPTYTNYTGLAQNDPSELKNMKGCKEMHFAPDPVTTSTDRRRKITNYETTRRECPDSHNDRDLSALITANPTLQWYWQVIFDTSHDSENDYIIKFDCKIVYYCSMSHNAKNAGES